MNRTQLTDMTDNDLKKNIVLKELSPIKRIAKKNDDVPEIYRPQSNYQKIFSILYKCRIKGITREKLVKKAMAVTGRSEELCRYAVGIITSPQSSEEGGGGHRSSKPNKYWVQKYAGGLLILHLRSN